MSTMTYPAAYINECRLTGPEHSHFGAEDILAIGIQEAHGLGLIGDDPHLVREQDITVSLWTDTGFTHEHA